MDSVAERIQSDLKGLVTGDVLFDPVHTQLYATDASLYETRPLGVVRPRRLADVVACVRYAAENKLTLHPRGAGGGLAGESLGPGIVLDFARYMRRFVHDGDALVRCQPGVILGTLNRSLGSSGWHLGPDPASPETHTLGGLIGVNGSGSRFLKYGAIHDHVESLQVVFADGSVHELSQLEVQPAELPSAAAGEHDASGSPGNGHSSKPEQMASELAKIHARYAPYFEEFWPRSRVNRCGYHLPSLVVENGVDFRRLLCGSAGTLALVTEATLRLSRLPKHRGVVLLMFGGLEMATLAVREILKREPSACDLLDRRHLSLARQANAQFERMIPQQTEALLIVEKECEQLSELIEWQNSLVDWCRRKDGWAFDSRQTFAPQQVEQYWQLARSVTNLLHGTKGGTRPLPFVEDMAVPPEHLSDFLLELQSLLKRHRVVAAMYAHAGHGQVHLRPFLDLNDSHDVARLEALSTECAELVIKLRGTVSGEHGDGYSRTRFISRQYGPIYPAFLEIKRLFDPWGQFNANHVCTERVSPITESLRPRFPALAHASSAEGPLTEFAQPELAEPQRWNGTSGDSHGSASAGSLTLEKPLLPEALAGEPGIGPVIPPMEAHLPGAEGSPAETNDLVRPLVAPSVAPLEPLPAVLYPQQLEWRSAELLQVVQDCNGCGACRAEQPGKRMCPMYRAFPGEDASPRAKANLLRGLLSNSLPWQSVASEAFRSVADLCIHCHMCRIECASHVDVPSLMAEAKAANALEQGVSMADRILADAAVTGGWGARFPRLTNWLLGDRLARLALERMTGLAAGRKLPRYALQSFVRKFSKRKLSRAGKRSGPKVLYFIDSYANWFDPELAEALVAVFEHNGIPVLVPPQPLTSGHPFYALGLVDKARAIAKRNAVVLGEAIRQGFTIVATEPSAALSLQREYARLLPAPEAELIAQHSQDACGYLWQLHQQGGLKLDFQPLSVSLAYHTPCHVLALRQQSQESPRSPAESLLRLVPGLSLQAVDKGCSGMGGLFGVKRENFRASLRMGMGLIAAMREHSVQMGATECSACKMQMEQGVAKPTMHPLKLLALAYGLMPELRRHLTERSGELTVT